MVAVARELEAENYHDIKRITARKDNVIRLWEYLLELLRARRQRLEMNLGLQKIFQEMLYIMDWMDEMKVKLDSKEARAGPVRPLCSGTRPLSPSMHCAPCLTAHSAKPEKGHATHGGEECSSLLIIFFPKDMGWTAGHGVGAAWLLALCLLEDCKMLKSRLYSLMSCLLPPVRRCYYYLKTMANTCSAWKTCYRSTPWWKPTSASRQSG